jgi:HEAT repeat protein
MELHKYGISQGSLRAALRDPRPQVRSLAAGEIAQKRDFDSIAAIEQVLKIEKNGLARFNMASALVELKSSVGNDALGHICEDASVSDGLRLQAASRLMDANDERCLTQVANILKESREPSGKISALLTLSKAGSRSQSLTSSIHPTLISNLKDIDPAVRQYAGQCIAAMNDQAAVPYLKTAIKNESDPLTKDRMQNSLDALDRIQ